MTIHTIRKSCTQNWADHLPMNVVKELMGHSSIKTTEEFYSTVDATHQKLASDSIQRLIEPDENLAAPEKSDAQVTPDQFSSQNRGDK